MIIEANTQKAKNMNSVTACIAGATIAAAGAVVATAHSKKENREKIGKTLEKASSKANGLMEEGTKKVVSMMNDMKDSSNNTKSTHKKSSVKRGSSKASKGKASSS